MICDQKMLSSHRNGPPISKLPGLARNVGGGALASG